MAALVLTEEEVRALVREEVRRALGEATAPDSLTTEQAADAAGVTPKTIRQWIADGRLPASHRGRLRVIRRTDLSTLLAGNPAGDAASVVASLRRSR